jgi:hypothetical protein
VFLPVGALPLTAEHTLKTLGLRNRVVDVVIGEECKYCPVSVWITATFGLDYLLTIALCVATDAMAHDQRFMVDGSPTTHTAGKQPKPFPDPYLEGACAWAWLRPRAVVDQGLHTQHNTPARHCD